ncbi:hypothetical protein QL898_05585 [Psychrobacter sp. APC 3279]|uniref:hypothetical protein n=1 Tax=Psychrobacter sp. APC 3279 TaxID=3035189 RepID=UPI0025B45795|nr:hypothetical protein [Psychrobacter sp. APC 3279]MDN3441096.1 hypothetical protein [Psychrobacter sp. APC 3279]
MASSLQLRLERAISSNRLSSALELPLDRKLGDLSRYKYVYADALPLPLERKISEQPAPHALYLALSQPLGTLAPVMYVTSNALPLPLSELISEQPPSNALPLGLTRKLGTVTGGYVPPITPPPVDPEEPTDPEPPPPEYAPPLTALASYISSVITGVRTINHCRDWHHNGHHIANDRAIMRTDVINVGQRYVMRQRGLIAIANPSATLTSRVFELAAKARISYIAFIHITGETQYTHSGTVGYTRCTDVHSAKVAHYRNCATLPLQAAVNYSVGAGHKVTGVGIAQCQATKVQQAVLVPDRYYPIPEPPPDKPDNVCRIRPPSSQLPLRMARQRNGLLSSHLPLSLTCWHDDPPFTVPSLRTYIMHHTITANIGGIAVDPLGFNIKTDMDSHYWSGGVSISPDDHAKIKHKLDVEIGAEPMINVAINNLRFSIIAENASRSRSFGKTTHGLDGRSITARLGADYAAASDRLFEQANYASQIVNEQLADLPFTANFEIDDWLVPASTYAVSNKTPMAVIADISEAAGGFVESHPTDSTMTLKKRWKINAWELATTTPDVTIPAHVIKSATDKTVKNTRYNTILLVGNVGHEVFRATQGRDMAASTLNNALFTAREVTVPKGSAVLSDSGTHSIQTLDLIFDDSIPLAQLGQIWQINDTDGAWRGVITGVALDCKVNNDTPEIGQSVTIDRYMDN